MRHMQRLHGGPHGIREAASGKFVTRPQQYERVAAVLFLGRRRQVFDDLVARSGARPGDRILDIGCGTGYFTRRAAHAVGPGGLAVGIDPSPSVVEYAALRAPHNCSFEVATAQNLPYPDASFDVVISSLAIHHLPVTERPAALREAYRVLRPDGRLFIADVRRPRNHATKRLFRALTHRGVGHTSPDALAALIAGAGFDVISSGNRRPWLHYVQAQRPAADFRSRSVRPEEPPATTGTA